MRRLVLSVILCWIGIHAKSQVRSAESGQAVRPEFSYLCDYVVNMQGGIKTGFAYLVMANLNLDVDLEKSGLWRGGYVHFSAANTHGAMPSAELFGDAQVVTNIEAGNHTFVHELWVKQIIGRFELILGLQDLNVEFVTSEHGGDFLNSSFGILPVISGNMTAPIYPLTTPGLTVKWNIDRKNTFLIAVYDGCPTGFRQNPCNLNWDFRACDGILAITEIQHTHELNGLKGVTKTGVFVHTHGIGATATPDFPDSLRGDVSGVYLVMDQILWQSDQKSIGMFLQAGYTPFNRNGYDFSLGSGICFKGFLSRSNEDVAGLAATHADFTGHAGSETAIELTWKKQIQERVFIQPDLQYVIHPSGVAGNLENCLAGILRFGISF